MSSNKGRGKDNIFTSCRKGDLERVRYLVEKKEIGDLNIRDCWDSTPLYYACHCGHKDIVEYLLQNGARCQANTFDGERCLYGSLTDDIKRLLINSKVIYQKTKQRDDFDEFCEKMLSAEEFSDISAIVGSDKFEMKLHRCILAARSLGFKKLIMEQFKDRNISAGFVDLIVFRELIEYLYTGRLMINRDDMDWLLRLSTRLKMDNLIEYLDGAEQESFSYELFKTGVRISTLIVDTPTTRSDLVAEFGSIIHGGIPEEFADPIYHLRRCAGVEMSDPYYDLCLEVDEYKFYCNKVFLCKRSEFFNILVEDRFEESRMDAQGVPIIPMRNIKPMVLSCILYYIYTNAPFALNEDIVFDVLEAANMYFLPGLKKYCANILCGFISLENVIDLLKIARCHELPKLEDKCSGYLATNIFDVVQNEDFRKFILSDAEEVTSRQETDSIAIIDDIRYHISNELETYSEVMKAQEKLKIIDDLLEELNLDA